MKKGSTLFLKFVLLLIAAFVLFILLWSPHIEGRAANLDFINVYADPVILYVYLVATPFFIALFQAFKILGFIEKNKVFSQVSVNALKNIKYCAVIISFMLAGMMPAMMQFAQQDDAPGFVLLGVVAIFAAVVIATGVAVAQKLLQSAVDMKSENDLTV